MKYRRNRSMVADVTQAAAERGQRGLFAGITVVVSSVAAVTLMIIGQPLWCSCGTWSPWSWDIWSSHNSQHLIDPYTFTHVLHGILFCAVVYQFPRRVPSWARYATAIVLEAGWEVLENLPMIIDRYRTATISLDYSGDSVANSVADILACAVGYAAANRLRAKWSVAVFVLTEVLLVLTIRDCLILNVVMLICPVESVRQWQMGK
jgi:hypothetical protein